MGKSQLETSTEQKICPLIFNTKRCYRESTEQPPICISGDYTHCINYQSLIKQTPKEQ